MLRLIAVVLIVFGGPTAIVNAQAMGMPLVPAATNGGSRFFLEGDVQWASTKLNGNVEPREYDQSFVPQLTMGWNLSPENALVLDYRYLSTQVKEVFDLGVPDLESSRFRKMNLQTADIAYRERLGGPDAPLGMEVDMGFRFAWANFRDEREALTIAGPVFSQQEMSFVTGGTRLGIKPYWTFDPSAWKMTLYAQAHLAYLWGSFHSQAWHEQLKLVNVHENSTIFNWDAEAGFSMYFPGLEGILQVAAGYRYEVWSVDRLGFMTGSDSGQLTQYGPFLRLQWSF